MKHSIFLSLLAAPALAQLHAPELDAPFVAYRTTAYPNGLGPWDSELVDLDLDGALDLVTVSWPTNPRLSILFGDGLGGFEAPVQHVPPRASVGVRAADLDGDGDQDLCVSDSGQQFEGQSFSYWQNQGDGTFATPALFAAGGAPAGIDVADVDGDGALDVVVAHDKYIAYASTVGLALGNGDGTFQPPLVFTAGSGTRDVAAGDVTGDGRIDLAVGLKTKKIAVLKNNGLGLDPPQLHDSILTGWFNEEANVHLADIDLDADLDLLFSSATTGDYSGNGAIALFRNPGNGAFPPPETVALDPAEGGAYDVAVADLTGDGWPDLLAPTGYRRWSLVAGDGAGGFLPAQSRQAGDGPSFAEAGDLDGDGDLDAVIVAIGSADASVHLNQGQGVFPGVAHVDMLDPSAAPASSANVASADLDLDGDLDVVVGYSENWIPLYGISVRLNLGDGAFGPALLQPQPEFPEFLTLGDLDGDLLPDAVWMDGWNSYPPRLRLARGRGDGSFFPATVLPGSWCGQDVGLALLDVNADQRLDVLVYDCYDRVSTLINTGGAFLSPKTHVVSGGSGALAGGDFNGDGFADVATNSGVQGYVEISHGNGDGTYQPPFTETTGRGVEAIAAADIDADGLLDLACAYSLDGDGVSVLIGRPDGTFKPPKSYPGTYSGETDDVRIADLDGDGRLDVLSASHGAQHLSYWRGLGGGDLEPQRRYGTGLPPTSLAPGDFTGDGLTDVLALVEPDGVGDWYYPAVVLLEGRPALWTDLGHALAGAAGEPSLDGAGSLAPKTNLVLDVAGAAAGAPLFYVAGNVEIDLPIAGGVLVPSPTVILPATAGAGGAHELHGSWLKNQPAGAALYFQVWALDAAGPFGLAATNGLRATQP